MSYGVLAPLVAVATLAAIVGGTLYLLAAYDRIVSKPRDEDAPEDPAER
ncbi:MAG: hypothetical protein AAF763_11960 [Pseudomonadota bacterium]